MAIRSFSHSDRTSETGDRTRRVIYILSNAALQCIGQTIILIVIIIVIIRIKIRIRINERKL